MAMEGTNSIVCSMCGDVGFPDKLFQCIRCHSRFQHSYCTNYYDERTTGVCDWCRSEDRSALKHGLPYSNKKSAGRDGAGSGSRFEYTSSDRVKENGDQEESGHRGGKTGSSSSSSSTKPTGRRYKLLKDVLC